MIKYVELSFDSSKPLAIPLDLCNFSCAAWNHFLIEQNDNNRLFYIASMIKSNVVAREIASLIRGIVFKENHDIVKLMNTFSGRVLNSENVDVNILDQAGVSYQSRFYNNTISQSFKLFIEKLEEKYGLLSEYTIEDPYALSLFVKKNEYFKLSKEDQDSLQTYLKASYNPEVFNLLKIFIVKILNINEIIFDEIVYNILKSYSLGDKPLEYDDLIEEANNSYDKTIKDKLIVFKNDKQNFKRLFSNTPTDISKNTVLIVNKNNDLSELISTYFINYSMTEASTTKDCFKVFFADSFLSNNLGNCETIVEALRSSRKRGLTTIISEGKFPQMLETSLKYAILGNCQTTIMGGVGDSAPEIIKEYRLEDVIKLQNLKHDYGLTVKNKSELNKKCLRQHWIENFSIKDKEVSYAQAMLLTSDRSKIKEVKNRFVNYIVDKTGIFNIYGELMPNDLEYIDKELTKLKLDHMILLLSQKEIFEETLYSSYGYKKCKNKITVKYLNDYYEEVEAFIMENQYKIQQIIDLDKKEDGKLLVLTDEFNLL